MDGIPWSPADDLTIANGLRAVGKDWIKLQQLVRTRDVTAVKQRVWKMFREDPSLNSQLPEPLVPPAPRVQKVRNKAPVRTSGHTAGNKVTGHNVTVPSRALPNAQIQALAAAPNPFHTIGTHPATFLKTPRVSNVGKSEPDATYVRSLRSCSTGERSSMYASMCSIGEPTTAREANVPGDVERDFRRVRARR